MTQTTEFDIHTGIRKLAETEWPCPYSENNVHNPLVHPSLCPCRGTGRIVPFASLRISCGGASSPASIDNAHYHGDLRGAGVYRPDCPSWVPELDVRVACWEIIETHPVILRYLMDRPEFYGEPTLEGEPTLKEAVLHAAQAWVKEQHDRRQNG